MTSRTRILLLIAQGLQAEARDAGTPLNNGQALVAAKRELDAYHNPQGPAA